MGHRRRLAATCITLRLTCQDETRGQDSLCEHERDHVSEMHAVAARPSPSIQEERLPLLIAVEDLVKVSARQRDTVSSAPRCTVSQNEHAPMRKEQPPPQEDMWTVPGQPLESLQDRLVDPPRAELVDELVVVDRELLAVGRDGPLHVPGRHDLIVRIRSIGGLDCGCRALSGEGRVRCGLTGTGTAQQVFTPSSEKIERGYILC